MASGIDNATGVSFASGQPYYDHWLTNFFLDLYADARNNSSVWWNQVKKVPHTPVSGRFIIWPVRTTRNTGRNSIRPGGLLPDPGAQGGATYSMETRTLMARVKIDGETLRRGKTNGGAFVTAEQLEIDGQLDDIQIENNRQAHNDGSGRMCEVSGWTGTTITLRINQSIEGAGTCLTKPVLYLEVGDRIGFYLPGGVGVETIRSTTAGQEGVYVKTILSDSTIEVALSPGGTALNVSAYTTAPAANDWVVRLSQEDVTISSGADAHRESTSCW